MMIGEIFPPRTMILREHIKEATSSSGMTYELYLTFGASRPLIKSRKTGKYYALSSTDLVDLAIDSDDEIEERNG